MSTQLPTVSVVVLTYQHEKYIEACLRSLSAIRYSNFEVVVLDDGSTDRTAEVAGCFADQADIPIRVLRQENTGRTAANTQKLIDATEGTYVLMMSGDDMLFPGYPLDEIVANLEETQNMDFVLPYLVYFDEDPTKKTPHFYNAKFIEALRSGDPKRVLEEHLFQQVSMIFLQGTVIRRSLINSTGGFDEELLADDYSFILRIFTHMANCGHIFKFHENASWLYRVHPENVHKAKLRQSKLILEVVAKYVPQDFWKDFDWSHIGVSEWQDYLTVRQWVFQLFGPKIGQSVLRKIELSAIKSARKRRDYGLLGDFLKSEKISFPLKLIALKYLLKSRLKSSFSN